MFLSVLSPLCYQTNKINVIRVHVVKTQLYIYIYTHFKKFGSEVSYPLAHPT